MNPAADQTVMLHAVNKQTYKLVSIFQMGSYGGKLKYTITYVSGSRGTELEDADVQIIVSIASS